MVEISADVRKGRGESAQEDQLKLWPLLQREMAGRTFMEFSAVNAPLTRPHAFRPPCVPTRCQQDGTGPVFAAAPLVPFQLRHIDPLKAAEACVFAAHCQSEGKLAQSCLLKQNNCFMTSSSV